MDLKLFIITMILPTIISLLAVFIDRFVGLFTIDRHSIKRIKEFLRTRAYSEIQEEIDAAEKKKTSLMKNWGYELACITIALILSSFGIWYGNPESFPIFNYYNMTDLVLVWLILLLGGILFLVSASLSKHYDNEIIGRANFSLSSILKWIRSNRFTLICNGIGFTSLVICLGILTNVLIF